MGVDNAVDVAVARCTRTLLCAYTSDKHCASKHSNPPRKPYISDKVMFRGPNRANQAAQQ